MCDCRGVLFPGPGFQDFFHLGEGEVAFVFAIVKMGREAHASFGPVVDEDFAGEKFAANFVGVRTFDRRSEEHTSELQSHSDLVCRLLLEKKKENTNIYMISDI